MLCCNYSKLKTILLNVNENVKLKKLFIKRKCEYSDKIFLEFNEIFIFKSVIRTHFAKNQNNNEIKKKKFKSRFKLFITNFFKNKNNNYISSRYQLYCITKN